MPTGNDLVALPAVGRRYSARRRVRLGDASPEGRLRLDGVARYLQDVADDDAVDAGVGAGLPWVLRRTVLEVQRWPRLGEALDVTTVCTAIGARWAERRTSLTGAEGGRVEAAALWVLLDRAGRPTRLPPGFVDVFGPSAAGRTVSPRLHHPDPPPGAVAGVPFALRRSDLDGARHVNNAVDGAIVEDHLEGGASAAGRTPGPLRAEVEHRRALEPGARPIVVAERDAGGRLQLWVLDQRDGQSAVVASALAMPVSGSTS